MLKRTAAFILSVLVLTEVGAAPPQEDAKAVQARFARCSDAARIAGDLPDEAWKPVAVEMNFHRRFYERAGIAMPTGGRMIAIASGSAHHGVYHRFSRVLVRDARSARWRVSDLRQQGRAYSGETDPPVHREEILDDARSATIDLLLADPCLYLEPTAFDSGTFMSGSGPDMMNIITPDRSRATTFFPPFNMKYGRNRALLDVVLPGGWWPQP